MRQVLYVVTFALVAMIGVCAAASAQPATGQVEDSAELRGDRTAARACLDAAESAGALRACADVVYQRCWASLPTRELATTAQQRWCHYRASVAWQGELEVSVGLLSARLDPAGRAQLEASQVAWEETSAADLRLALRLVGDDVIRRAEAAGLHARGLAARVQFIEHVLLLEESSAGPD